ncbi:hypothetical protein SEA_BOGOTA_46 [Streptomyces phage Bogota]|jgi:hypothetical protein|nr:hypothetical protein SEA_UNTPL_47 [Streptomyces phage UNTPL]WIC89196.1 hypothetical protein SEA_BOGOTA_46 [Streptomyces phage Bogota]
MSRKNRRARLIASGYSPTMLDRLEREGIPRPPAAKPKEFVPSGVLAMVQHPERGRYFQRIKPATTGITLHAVWVSDDAHPLGGYLGSLTLHRRVNLRKDDVPRWIRDRPLYEFTKEQPR